jgi:sugar-specific transcriptional regulator TrmB
MTIARKQERLAELIKARDEARAELTESQKDELWGCVRYEHALIEEIEELSESIDYMRDLIEWD